MMSFLRHAVFHNFGLKLAALMTAVFLWFTVARDPIAEIAVDVPVEFQHPGELELVSTGPVPHAQIVVRGPSRILRRMAQAEVHAAVDLASTKPGEVTFDLASGQIRVPSEVSIVEVAPAQLHVTLDRRAYKEVAIQARVVGRTAEGPAETVTVQPSTAAITGPAEHVKSIDAVLTDPVDVTGISESASFAGVHLYASDPLVRVVRPSFVTVRITANH